MKQWAEILRAVADGKEIRVAKTDSYLAPQEVLKAIASNSFRDFESVPADFRICEPSIIVNGHRCPAPCREPLDSGMVYFVPCITENGAKAAGPYTWGVNPEGDSRRLDTGLVYKTVPDATARASCMLMFSEG